MNEPMQSQPPIFNLFWRRCAAFFYDSLLLLALYFIKLVNDKPGPLKTSQCFHRYLSGSLMFILCYLWMLKKPPGQALQDRLSKTQIVNE